MRVVVHLLRDSGNGTRLVYPSHMTGTRAYHTSLDPAAIAFGMRSAQTKGDAADPGDLAARRSPLYLVQEHAVLHAAAGVPLLGPLLTLTSRRRGAGGGGGALA